jgi:hypothetical protein
MASVSKVISLPMTFVLITIGKPIEKVMCIIIVVFTILGPTKQKLLNSE